MIKQSEIVFGIVCPVGVNHQVIYDEISEKLKPFGYMPRNVRITTMIETMFADKLEDWGYTLNKTTEYDRITNLIDACNELRRRSKNNAIAVLAGVSNIFSERPLEKRTYHPYSRGMWKEKPFICRSVSPFFGTVHVFRTLKHTEEVRALRDIYGEGFYLLGFNAPVHKRREYLTKDKGLTEQQANELIKRDAEELERFGQHTSDVFQYSDVFININDFKDSNSEAYWRTQLERFIRLVFGDPLTSYPTKGKTPTKHEYAMFLAFAASMRSGDLSRQVGAVIMKEGEIIATGANDVPQNGGGQYGSPDEGPDCRDVSRGFDANEMMKHKMLNEVGQRFFKDKLLKSFILKYVMETLEGASINDITEYGRAVHAEMAALMACARSGVSPKGGILYCTTFPCHNCAKHIISAGISEVWYIEPYPKSKVYELHSDSVEKSDYTLDFMDSEKTNSDSMKTVRMKFIPFVGIGPWRYLDFFAMKNSRGNKIVRKDKETGKAIAWSPANKTPRIPMLAEHYIDREKAYIKDMDKLFVEIEEN